MPRQGFPGLRPSSGMRSGNSSAADVPRPQAPPRLPMRWIPALLLPLTPVFSSAQQEQAVPVISVAGQDFYTWQQYTSSPLFQQLNLRCGTKAPGSVLDRMPTSDCSASSTTIQPEYVAAGHTLYRIPVVVHILTSGSAGSMSDARVRSQIDVLNEDFQALAGTLGENGNDARIEFFLASEDPSGNPTTGITRTNNTNYYNDNGSYWTTLAWDTTRYLNIYTNLASGALGYVPDLPQGGIVGSSSDRVVVLHSAFGRNAPIGAPYDLGRSATHEVGHYLGLYHTFDFGCGTSACYTSGDRICDTARESNPVFGCPATHASCTANDPFHNYMDYSDDDCMSEFTPEQVNRMRCTLSNWRVDLPEPALCGVAAAVVTRNGGLNLNVYTATPPVMGATTTLTVADATHASALIVGRAAPGNVTLPSGFVLLTSSSSTRFFSLSLPLPLGNAVVPVPSDAAVCGLTAYTQALLLGGSALAFSNAVDLTAGI
ncbi:MAG: zinc metalloprotease [Planctomycetes bacterium]|nr:zinc metalloprotease [Planctomycetota bacterium]